MSSRSATISLQLASLEDLVILASSMPIPIINVHSKGSSSQAFIFFEASPSTTPIVYYCELAKSLTNKFTHVERVTGKISYGDEVSVEPNIISIPIVQVQSHNLAMKTP